MTIEKPENQDRPSVRFQPKLWPISVEGKWGFIDANGTVKIEPQYAAASPFREGLALVSVTGTRAADQAFTRTYDSFIDEFGQFIIPPEFPAFFNTREAYDCYAYSSFEDGVAVVRDASSSNGLRGLIDSRGNLLVPMIYRDLGSFGEGLCSFEVVHENGRSECGYMDYRGNVVIKPKGFLYGSRFSEGRAVVTVRTGKRDHPLLIDRQGTVLVGPNEYSAISGMAGGLSRVVKNGKIGLIDRDGRVIVPLGEYIQISEPDPGHRYIAERDGGFYTIEYESETSKLPDFGAEPMRYRGDLIWISADGRHGYAKPDGTIAVDPIFDEIWSFEGELVQFLRGAERGYVNRSGEIVWSTVNWEPPLRYSIREPLQSYLPPVGVEAMPLSYNWDCENAIVFVYDGSLAELRKFYLEKHSADVTVSDYTDFTLEPGKLNINISFEGVAYLEVYAIHGDRESKDAENTDYFVSFYHCENMLGLRKKYPDKTIGIILQN